MRTPQKSLTPVLGADFVRAPPRQDMPSVAGESIFIHAGDANTFSRSMAAIADFDAWLGDLPYTHRILIPGNQPPFLGT